MWVAPIPNNYTHQCNNPCEVLLNTRMTSNDASQGKMTMTIWALTSTGSPEGANWSRIEANMHAQHAHSTDEDLFNCYHVSSICCLLCNWTELDV
jgi:hypothetical protein